jgi:hypothetical protein
MLNGSFVSIVLGLDAKHSVTMAKSLQRGDFQKLFYFEKMFFQA